MFLKLKYMSSSMKLAVVWLPPLDGAGGACSVETSVGTKIAKVTLTVKSLNWRRVEGPVALLPEQTRTYMSAMICNCLQLSWKSAIVLTVWNCCDCVHVMQTLQLSWLYATVLTVFNCLDSLQLSEYAMVCAVSALVSFVLTVSLVRLVESQQQQQWESPEEVRLCAACQGQARLPGSSWC